MARLVLRDVHAFFAAAYGTRDGVSDFSIALDILGETEAATLLITRGFPLDDANAAFDAAAGRAGDSPACGTSGRHKHLPNV